MAAYKWQVQLVELDGHQEERFEDYRFHANKYPPGVSMESYIRADDTILPGGALNQDLNWGIFLRPSEETEEAVRAEVDQMILPLTFAFRLATETSPGELKYVELRSVASAQELTNYIVNYLHL